MTQCHSDPQNTRTDAELISSLQRAWLLPREGRPDPVVEAKFSLDSTVGDEGMLASTCSIQQLLILLQDPTSVLVRSSCLRFAERW
jgi:hypothetical protein